MAVAFGTDEFQREVKFITEIIGVRRGCTMGSVEKMQINSVKKYLPSSYLVAGTGLGTGYTNKSNSQYLNSSCSQYSGAAEL